MVYDPRDWGAMCGRCALREARTGAPVPGKSYRGSSILVAGESPGKKEVEQGEPFVGASGGELDEGLVRIGLRRRDCTFINMLPCQPPKNKAKGGGKSDLNAFLLRCKNAKLPSPVECCGQRMWHDVAQFAHDTGMGTEHDPIPMFTLGEHASKFITGTDNNISKLRGGPQHVYVEADGPAKGLYLRVMPTWHPAFILRQKFLRRTFWEDLARGMRFFTGQLHELQFRRLYVPTIKQIETFLAGESTFWVLDTETRDGRKLPPWEADPSVLDLYTLQILNYTTRTAMVIPWRGIPEGRNAYGETGFRKIVPIVARAFRDGRLWVTHNGGGFDRPVLEHHFGTSPSPMIDTINLHKRAFPLEPHDLDYLTSTLTDFARYKVTHEGEKGYAQSGEKLFEYGATDVVVTGDVAVILGERVEAIHQNDPCPLIPGMTLVELDHWMQDTALWLHKAGLYVDQAKQQELTAKFETKWVDLRKKCVETAKRYGFADFNPGSDAQVRRLLYDIWDLPEKGYTDGGAKSTKEAFLRQHAVEDKDDLEPDQVELLHDIRHYRRVRNKDLGTYIWKFSRAHPKTYVWPDGRVRADFKAHVTIPGRFSVSDPALQQMPFDFRVMFAAEPGRLMFGADMAQFHPRIFANLWNIPRLLEAAEAGDIYLPVAEALFGRDVLRKMPGYPKAPGDPWKGIAKASRKFGKEFLLSFAYGAKAHTMWVNLTSAEDADGNLSLSHLKESDVDRFRDKLLEEMPEFESGWALEVEMAENNGFSNGGVPWLADPLAGRRREFPGGAEQDWNEITNYRTLACESALIHLATMRVLDEIPWEAWGPGTGLVMQVHDQLSGECPADKAEWAAHVVAEAMNIRVPGWQAGFHGDPTFGPTWADA